MHGGLLPGESESVLTFARPGAGDGAVERLRETVGGVVADRCAGEGGRQPSVADMLPVLAALFGW
jgi:hypothetical protein